MSKQNNWNDQDEAFFGETVAKIPSRGGTGSRSRPSQAASKPSTSKTFSSDEELAKKLQEQYLNEQNESNGRRDQEDEDAALARKIQNEEIQRGNRVTPTPQNPMTSFPGNRRNIQPTSSSTGIVPRCSNCNQRVFMPVTALGNYYHRDCFKCVACHDNIRENERFAYMTTDDGIKHPMHKSCYAELYGIKCKICASTIESDHTGRVSYLKHPFFDDEYMCPKHSQDSYRKCTGCFRFEPIARSFADLNDDNRCVCDACLRTVIVDSDDAKPLWNKVLSFLEHGLKLPLFKEMREIPILIVGHDALNAQMASSSTGHGLGDSTQIMTRGLCLSEHQRGLNFLLPHMRFDRKRSSFLPSNTESNGYTYFTIPDANSSNPNSNVTAILCLSGLPSDLTASILAHEATHAWLKLHPHFDIAKPIPPQVEEGCCQLVAMLFLTDGLGCTSATQVDGGPSDLKLRQYFKFSIETARDDVYGEGYRRAARAYAEIGIEALLSHVVHYQDFPSI
ncbi:hypothetical protein CTEN210_02206 [Chaetoceros tenuissimus]|uniref:LIM zinc-binding domain-containing protein n=1 Tax=Chaetoceros tenuissimus TaxID=426638 RepID=A0AAD3CGL2_9STRA|nr:hypothetical protein CTEN210_02206 [Chaetoceros tenuissimus]